MRRIRRAALGATLQGSASGLVRVGRVRSTFDRAGLVVAR
jgi:hypothetical protein